MVWLEVELVCRFRVGFELVSSWFRVGFELVSTCFHLFRVGVQWFRVGVQWFRLGFDVVSTLVSTLHQSHTWL